MTAVRPIGIDSLIPKNILGKWIVVLVCYLDDSGSDSQNEINTVAGYIADQDQWKLFEAGVEPIFNEYKVPILHATDLHSSRGAFSEWSALKKESFSYKICKQMSPYVPLGMSMSAVKKVYKKRASESTRKKTNTVHTFCFNAILDWILTDVRIGNSAHTNGISFVMEAGHNNNGEVEQAFNNIREKFSLKKVLRSLSFVGKDNCRAIQMADLIAFYTRRNPYPSPKFSLLDHTQITPEAIILNIIASSTPIRAFVATDFDQPARPSSSPS